MSVKVVPVSIFANSLIKLLLFQIIFPFVSKTTNGNGELIIVLCAALSTLTVSSLICSEISVFLLLFDHIVYTKIAMYAKIDGIIALGSTTHKITNIIAITTKYIFVLEINLSKFNLVFGIYFISTFIYLFYIILKHLSIFRLISTFFKILLNHYKVSNI